MAEDQKTNRSIVADPSQPGQQASGYGYGYGYGCCGYYGGMW